MKSLALELGSDCPFFVDSAPAIGTGRGEILEPLNAFLKGYYLVLLNPGVRINTREAYRNCRPEPPQENLIHFTEKPIVEWRKYILNDFEQYAITKHPVIDIIKNELYSSGALFSLMSGSGSSVYGIFKVKPELPQKLKEFLIWEGFI
jgi:4-diphosphocytidyl-2-C-methyl-D-erythritol kinase